VNRLLPLAALALAFFAPAANAKTVVVADAQDGKAVILSAGDTLVVHLAIKSATASVWHLVYSPEEMLRLNGPPRYLYPPTHTILVYSGGPATEEFRFTVPEGKANFVTGAWLRFLFLSSFESGVKAAKLWEIRYTIKATP